MAFGKKEFFHDDVLTLKAGEVDTCFRYRLWESSLEKSKTKKKQKNQTHTRVSHMNHKVVFHGRVVIRDRDWMSVCGTVESHAVVVSCAVMGIVVRRRLNAGCCAMKTLRASWQNEAHQHP